MSLSRPCRSLLSALALLGVLYVHSPSASAQNPRNRGPQTNGHACPPDNSGLELPAGFCATVFADGIGHARHLVVAPNGVVYVNTWSGRYYGNDTPHAGGFLIASAVSAGRL
jgi:glucose/arabinose dehydrogenase